MNTRDKKRRAPRATTQLSVQAISLAARQDVLRSFDALIAKFIGEDAVRDAQQIQSSAEQGDLHQSYARLRDSAQALNRWHSDESFLTADGTPRPLRQRGKISLTSLADLVSATGEDSKRLVDDLINLGFVTKSGVFFLPAMRSAVVGQPSALILAHATAAITRLIGTVTHNISGELPARYERHVADVRIRSTDLPVFLRFVEQQSQYLIDSVDDWLSKREIKGTIREKEVSVGIGSFAWAEGSKASEGKATARGGAIVPRK